MTEDPSSTGIADNVVFLFEMLADRLYRGDVAAMAARYRVPLAIYMHDDILVIPRREDLIEALGIHRESLAGVGIVAVTVEVTPDQDCGAGRQSVIACWTFAHEDPARTLRNTARYMLSTHRNSGRLMVDMIEYLDIDITTFTEEMKAAFGRH